jgi:hypothetical protein
LTTSRGSVYQQSPRNNHVITVKETVLEVSIIGL